MGMVMEIGYAHYILGVKCFYASSAGSRCTDRWAPRPRRLREPIKLSPQGLDDEGSRAQAERRESAWDKGLLRGSPSRRCAARRGGRSSRGS